MIIIFKSIINDVKMIAIQKSCYKTTLILK